MNKWLLAKMVVLLIAIKPYDVVNAELNEKLALWAIWRLVEIKLCKFFMQLLDQQLTEI